ncbi:DNA-binding transcriptional regulator, XRE-family HTH domain [Lachnospiraceae bacterium XBB2008]|nr:DNA-binding transcriptional regulator, XRE-family HTH domain [Lachnospiraceae bacterium XBB2008]
MIHSKLAGSKIKYQREKLGLSQAEFGIQFAKFNGHPKAYAAMTISTWETGRKVPPAETMMELSKFFNVSMDYLYGLSSDDQTYETTKSSHTTMEIPYEKLDEYDGEPIYVVSERGMIGNQWGIMDVATRSIQLRNNTRLPVSKSPDVKYYITVPANDITLRHLLKYAVSMKDIMSGLRTKVYVKSLSQDPALRGAIEGWYNVDLEHNMLINSMGRTLSLDGLSVTYNAFSVQQ